MLILYHRRLLRRLQLLWIQALHILRYLRSILHLILLRLSVSSYVLPIRHLIRLWLTRCLLHLGSLWSRGLRLLMWL